jgi:hypothetical protein
MTARWIAISLMAAMGLPGSAQSPSQHRFTLTAGQVARAVARTHSDPRIQITDEQVTLLAKVVATDPDPVLDIRSVAPLGDRRSAGHTETYSKIKLVCRLPGTCLPFYAIVSWPAETAGRATTALSASPTVANVVSKTTSEITMRAGAHATLVMDDDRSHIQVPVISLENGIAGHRIRVASPDRKQVYVAEIVSANLLKGSF